MGYTVRLTPRAERTLRGLPRDIARRIKETLLLLAHDPSHHPHLKKLKGSSHSPLYSLRMGEYRIILTIEHEIMIIFVIEIGHRSTIYRSY